MPCTNKKSKKNKYKVCQLVKKLKTKFKIIFCSFAGDRGLIGLGGMIKETRGASSFF